MNPRDLRLPSAQERRAPAVVLRAGLDGLSARLEEKDLRRLWEAGEQSPEGGGEKFSDGEENEGEEGAYLGFRG